MSAEEIKVTDKRMFTPDGNLKEEYRHLENESTVSEKEEKPRPVEPPDPVIESPKVPESPSPEAPLGWDATQSQKLGIIDLISLLAEPAAIYLGDATLPDGSSAENFDAARLHIDMISVLQEKTKGNLTAQESAVLDDILYRFRLRYVQKTQ